MIFIIGFAVFVIIVIAVACRGDVVWPLLANRTSDPGAWRFDDVEPSVTAAYLEAVSQAFALEDGDVFMLRPGDSLWELYRSYYKSAFYSCDDMELEMCCEAFEKLCGSPEAKFDHTLSLRDQLKIISQYRNDRPVTEGEKNYMGLEMRFLPVLAPQNDGEDGGK
ncbi:MAG: hypothetical protein IJU70_06090 [Lentisphaeria bacterium]|nr:hypothetical protein [Lentisphaeria bacterium]